MGDIANIEANKIASRWPTIRQTYQGNNTNVASPHSIIGHRIPSSLRPIHEASIQYSKVKGIL